MKLCGDNVTPPPAAPTARRLTLLVADDVAEEIDILRALLGDDYLIRPAASGAATVRAAQLQPPPDLILLDMMMPDLDGHAVMRALQSDPRTRAIPVIVVTALTSPDAEFASLELGAVDYIGKPFHPEVVRARVRTQLALAQARDLLAQHNEHLRAERELVEDVVTRLRGAEDCDHRNLRTLLASVERSNGDMVLSSFAADGRQIVLVGDIAGHGLTAAVCSPLIAQVFRNRVQRGETLPEIVDALNSVMLRRLPTNLFMAACIVDISADRSSASLWNGGLPGCSIVRGNGEVARVDAHALPLGIVASDESYLQTTTLPLARGDRIYVFTDGVTEMTAPDGRPLGVDGIAALLAELESGSPDTAGFDALLPRLRDFRQGEDFADDLTLVEIAADAAALHCGVAHG
jgi:CheY-like chemotaxis protein